MAYTIKSLGYGQVAVLQNGKHVKKFGGASAATDARMFINKQHQASLPQDRKPGLKEHELAKELEGINNNIGSFTEDMLEQFEVSEINNMIENYQSFEKTVAILEEKGVKSSKAMAAFIGRKKYSGKKCNEAKEENHEIGTVGHYDAWVKDKGHLTRSASSVLMDYSKKHNLSASTHNALIKKVLPQVSDHKPYLMKESAEDLEEAKKPDRFHIINPSGNPANLVSYGTLSSAMKDRDEKHPTAKIHLVGPRGKVKHVFEPKSVEEDYIEEKLTEKDPSSKWIEDFVKSDNPKFAGKSKKERIKMALGAYYGSQNEEFDALAEEIAGLFEDSEQLDELKKSTLASYIKKSAVELPAHQTNATLKHTGPIANAHSGKHPKTGESPVQWDDRKVRNRQQGIIRGASKLAKESFADQFFDGEIIREEIQLPNLQEADKNYDAYFKACMKNAGITSISDLKTPEEKKEFMNKVDAGFKAKNEDMFYENFMRSDIDAKVADHEKSGNKVADVTHKIYQGKPYAEFTVTTPDGAKKKYIFHGNVTRHEKLA